MRRTGERLRKSSMRAFQNSSAAFKYLSRSSSVTYRSSPDGGKRRSGLGQENGSEPSLKTAKTPTPGDYDSSRVQFLAFSISKSF